MTGSRGRTLRFLANVDPIDVVGAGAAAAGAAWVAALWCCGVLFAAAGATLYSHWGVHVSCRLGFAGGHVLCVLPACCSYAFLLLPAVCRAVACRRVR